MKSVFKHYNSYLAVFAAAASVLQIIEWMLPHPVPWMKLGLANMITLLALIVFGGKFAFKVTILRILLSSFLLGTFLSPAFFFSLSGGIVSSLIMIAIYRPLGRLSPVGVSIIGAVFHNLAQVAVALLLIRHTGIIILIPFILIASLVPGFINGILALKIAPNLAEFSFRKIYLASSSPRRIKIMRDAGLPVIVVAHKCEEDKPLKGEDARRFAFRQALKKLDSLDGLIPPPGYIIAADTVVEVDGEIFIKPVNVDEAEYMLRKLSGNIQKVHTSLVIKNLSTGKKTGSAESPLSVETTILKMKKLSEEDIEKFKVKNLDKSGGYAIKGMKDKYIKWKKGSYSNVTGFPVKLFRKMYKMGKL